MFLSFSLSLSLCLKYTHTPFRLLCSINLEHVTQKPDLYLRFFDSLSTFSNRSPIQFLVGLNVAKLLCSIFGLGCKKLMTCRTYCHISAMWICCCVTPQGYVHMYSCGLLILSACDKNTPIILTGICTINYVVFWQLFDFLKCNFKRFTQYITCI